LKNTIILLACLIGFWSYGQKDIETSEFTQKSFKNQTTKERRNEVSLEILGFVDGRFIPAYERSFGKHWSAKIGAGPKSREGLLNLSGLDGEKIKTGDLNYSGFILYGEGRYYLNEFLNGRAIGFYMGLYLKYASYQTDITGTYTNSADEDFNFLFDTSIGVRSVGFMIGYKLPIRKRFAIDFIIAGPGTANYSFDIKNKSDQLPDEFYDDLNALLEEYNLLDLINADFDFRVNDRKSVFNTVNFRYSISFTFNF
jgi:hypothetical protein